MSSSPVVVRIWPAWRKESENPYSARFADELADELSHASYSVEEYWGSNVFRRSDVVVVHWPELALARRSAFARVFGSTLILLCLATVKLRSGRIIWVLHNYRPHERVSWPVIRLFYGCLNRLVDALIFPSDESERLAKSDVGLADKRSIKIPHGAYVPDHQDPGRAPAVDLLLFGQIRKYKGIEDLLRCLPGPSAGGSLRMRIAGAPSNPGLVNDIAAMVEGLDEVVLDARHLSENELSAAIYEADAVILPYREFTTSGAALCALSHGRPVIMPSLRPVLDIRNQVGAEWIICYDAPLTHAKLVNALARARHPKDRMPEMEWASWVAMADQFVALLDSIGVRAVHGT